MTRHKRLIESRASLMQFEEVQHIRKREEREFEKMNQSEHLRRRREVMQWLSPFMPEGLQDSYRAIRSGYPESGRWVLDNSKMQDWLCPRYCSNPLLWLNGLPGAGQYFR